jgi:hypothetical protein
VRQVSQELFLHQLAIKFKLQLRDAERRQLRRQQAQNDEQPRGPFIVCVDTSGSMGGFNEQCAKAFCLALFAGEQHNKAAAVIRQRDAHQGQTKGFGALLVKTAQSWSLNFIASWWRNSS